VAEWKTLTGIDLTRLEDIAASADDIASSFASFMQSLSTMARLISSMADSDVDVIGSLVAAAADSIEATILDTLQTNAATCTHLNIRWDKTWRYKKDPDSDARNWSESRDLPYTANGLNGWLADVYASTLDESNIFRPLTDEDTRVGGFIFVVGSPSPNALSGIAQIYDSFTDFSDFKELLDEKKLEMGAEWDCLARAGVAMMSTAAVEAVWVGNLIASEIKEELTDVGTDWYPSQTAYPKWISVPLARLLPPVYKLMERMRDVVSALRFLQDDPIGDLAELLAKRAELLADLAVEVGDIIQQILDLAAILEGGYFIWIEVPEGGMKEFIATAYNADEKPDLGQNAVFGGVVGVVTYDQPLNHFAEFFELVGISVSEYSESTTTRSEQIDELLEDAAAYFP
jgi:hypothetical protein